MFGTSFRICKEEHMEEVPFTPRAIACDAHEWQQQDYAWVTLYKDRRFFPTERERHLYAKVARGSGRTRGRWTTSTTPWRLLMLFIQESEGLGKGNTHFQIWSEILVRVCYKKGWHNQPLVHVLWKIWDGPNFNLAKKFVTSCSVAVEMSIHWFICICWFRNIV